ncbi:hypothetical protein b3_0228 [Synechococcus phage B3]|nr:hypothetical protein b3_0228 [Synechococcus phage B3]
MFSIKKLNKIYNKIHNQINNLHWTDHWFDNQYPNRYNSYDSLTERQWQNLFDVCCIIEANYDRFDMAEYHSYNECGTTHCLAGWAVALEANDPDFSYTYSLDYLLEKYNLRYRAATSDIAAAILSEYIKPFFYLYQGRNPENVMYREFILPVIEEGKKDGLIVSPHAQDFITKTTYK